MSKYRSIDLFAGIGGIRLGFDKAFGDEIETVFVSEWGTVNADGGGTVADANGSWQTWMDKYKLSSANWSVASLSEGASFFTTSGAWNYSQSGTWVKNNVLANNPSSYTKCAR